MLFDTRPDARRVLQSQRGELSQDRGRHDRRTSRGVARQANGVEQRDRARHRRHRVALGRRRRGNHRALRERESRAEELRQTVSKIKKAPEGAFLFAACCLAMLFVVVGAGLVTRVTTKRRATQRAERAAARHRGANCAASRCTADRAYGFTAAHARASGQTKHAGYCTKRYQRLQHTHLLVKTVWFDRWRLKCSRAAERSRTGRESARPAPRAGCSPSSLPAGAATAETFPCE